MWFHKCFFLGGEGCVHPNPSGSKNEHILERLSEKPARLGSVQRTLAEWKTSTTCQRSHLGSHIAFEMLGLLIPWRLRIFHCCFFCYFRLWMDSIYIGKQVGTLRENIGVVGMSCCDIKCESNKSNNVQQSIWSILCIVLAYVFKCSVFALVVLFFFRGSSWRLSSEGDKWCVSQMHEVLPKVILSLWLLIKHDSYQKPKYETI